MRRIIAEDEFGRMFRDSREHAFRLETLTTYALTYEQHAFERFLAGDPLPPAELDWWQSWLDQIAELTRQGKKIERVRLLAEPPSDYQRWELWGTPWHTRAGERIRYMPFGRAAEIGLPTDSDWWLFDDERLVIMGFDSIGRVTEKILITGQEAIGRYCEWRDLAIRNATSAEETAAA